MLREMGGGAAPSLLVSGDTKEGLRNPLDFSSTVSDFSRFSRFMIHNHQLFFSFGRHQGGLLL